MNLEDEKSWSFFMPQVKLSLLAGILLQQPPALGRVGPDCQSFRFPHMCLACIVQVFYYTRPLTAALELS